MSPMSPFRQTSLTSVPLPHLAEEHHPRKSTSPDKPNKSRGRSNSGNRRRKRPSTIEEDDPLSMNGLSLQEIISQDFAMEMAMDQDGSRFFQKAFPHATATEKTQLFESLRPHVLSLTNHVFGNWVIQLFFDYGNEDHMCAVVESFRGSVLSICMNAYGCRVIQKTIRSCPEYLQELILNELKGHVAQCIVDTNAHHVIEKCIVDAKSHITHFIVEEIAPMTLTFACHSYGCQIIERILFNFDLTKDGNHTDDPHLAHMISEIARNCVDLSLHKFGNYIVQDIIVRVSENIKDVMIKKLWDSIGILSCDKYASNVVEKCLRNASGKRSRKLFRKMMNGEVADGVIVNMIEDKFGNYVIQTLYTCLSAEDAVKFHERITSICDLNKSNYGKHILNAFKKHMQSKQTQPKHPLNIGKKNKKKKKEEKKKQKEEEEVDNTPSQESEDVSFSEVFETQMVMRKMKERDVEIDQIPEDK